MFKKALLFLLSFCFVFSFCATALASDSGYAASASSYECSYGETLTFQISTPQEAFRIKAYISGKFKGEAQLEREESGQRYWTVQLAPAKVGDNKVTFKAYSQSGKRLCTFPESPVLISVKHLPPVTEAPIVLDCDRAVLLGTPPANCGVKQREHGFYYGTSPDALTTKVKSNKIIRGKTNKLVFGLLPETTYYYQAYTVTSKGTVYGGVVSFTTPVQKAWAAQDAVFADTSGRYTYLFGADTKFYTTKSPPYGYASSSEASKHMVRIDVPVWKIKGGKRVPGTMPLTINYKLENNVKAIFQEIYDLDIQFPIKVLSGYSYRRIVGPGLTGSQILSHHSYGAAIDINKPNNLFYRYRDKRNPNSPYYIPQSVIDIFAKYGWAWGGNFKEGFDTMHFQYLGLDLTD